MLRHALRIVCGLSVLTVLAVSLAVGQPSPAPKAVTFERILELLQLEVPEAKLKEVISQSPTKFTLSPDQIKRLKLAGASNEIIELLRTGPTIGADSSITSYVLILDCSNSMQEPTDARGTPKFEAARKAALDLIAAIPDGKELGFIVYGYDAKYECRAVASLRPMGAIDAAGRKELTDKIAQLKPAGHTPIANSLKVAAKHVQQAKGKAKVVLITDGMETCHGDPEAEAAKLKKDFPAMAGGVNVIGFGLKPEEKKKVAAIATAGGGQFFDAATTKELVAAVKEVKQTLASAAPPPKPPATKPPQAKPAEPKPPETKPVAAAPKPTPKPAPPKEPPVKLGGQGVMVWVDKAYGTPPASLYSELWINEQIVDSFTSGTRKPIDKYFKPGENLIVLKTKPNPNAEEANPLSFSIGPVTRESSSNFLMQPIWTFRNGTDWDFTEGKHVHPSGQAEVELRFPVYYAGPEVHARPFVTGSFVVQTKSQYGSTNTSVLADIFVNDQRLTTALNREQQIVVTPYLKSGRNELKVISRPVHGVVEKNDVEVGLLGYAEQFQDGQNHSLLPIAHVRALSGWNRDKETGRLTSRVDPEAETIEYVIPFYLDHDPNEGLKSPVPRDEPVLMFWSKPDSGSSDPTLHSEVKINGEILDVFASETRKAVASLIKPGRNTIEIRTTIVPWADEIRSIDFSIGLVTREPGESKLVMQPIWGFGNGADWKIEEGRAVHASGAGVKEITLTVPFEFATVEHRTRKFVTGAYLLQSKGSSRNPTVIVTATVNGVALNSFGREPQDVVITPFLKQGKNEVTFVTERVDNLLEDNPLEISIGGPIDYDENAQTYRITRDIIEWKSLEGWKRNPDTKVLESKADPSATRAEQTLTFVLEEDPNAK